MTAEKIGSAVFVLAIALLAFIAGAFVMLREMFPADVLRQGYMAGTALIAKREMSQDRFKTDMWHPARRTEKGVTIQEPAWVFPGHTLYTSGDGPYARLIALDGRVVHEWRRPYSEVWQEGAAVKTPQPDELIYMRKARLLPNGDLLAIYEAAGDTPWGYGMVKLDRDSEVVWSYLANTHHDFDLAPDGRIFALTHEFTSEKLKGVIALGTPRLDDFAVVLSPEGEEIKKISLTHALFRSRYNAFLYAIPAFSSGDPLHTNAIEYITPERAARFPFGKAGDVLLSFRDIGVIAVLDLEREEIVWAARGAWLGQHDPTLLANGHILLFDNLGGFAPGNDSRVLEIDPRTMEIVWRYAGDKTFPFSSLLRSAAQPLGNGNILVTESDGGRLFEVTPAGEIVWEYLNPVRGGDDGRYIPVVSWGTRIDPATLDPDFRAALEAVEEVSP
jgi:hypothetical protein